MPPRRIINIRNQLLVYYRGDEIGILTWVPERKQAYFFFSKDYFRKGYDICPITHPKDDPSSRFAIYGESMNSPDKSKSIYNGLPPFIADSLPDNWGNTVFDEWFKERRYPDIAKTPLTKLAFIGNRAMGAFEFRPLLEPGFYKDKPVDLQDLYNESLAIEDKLRGETAPGEGASIREIAALGTSPGGNQKKAIISIAPDGTYHSGKTSPVPGWKHCILKFNTPEYSLAEIEKTYYDLATESGIRMMPSRLVKIGGIRHFLTERYDREGDRKIITQSLAAINPEAETYEDLFRTCRRLGLPENETTMLFRQTAFNFIMGNTDDHRKNFSFILAEDNTWHLSPAYDINFIIARNGILPEKSHCMSLGGKFEDVSDEDLIRFATANDIKAPEKIIRKIREVSLLFEEKARENGINAFCTEMISKRLNELGRRGKEFVIPSYSETIDGTKVEGIRFEKTEKGNIHIHATIAGKQRRFVVTPGKELHAFILDNGFNTMAAAKKTEVIKRSFMKENRFQETP